MLLSVIFSLLIGWSLSQDCNGTVTVNGTAIGEGVASGAGVFFVSDFTNFLIAAINSSYDPTPYNGALRALDCDGNVVHQSDFELNATLNISAPTNTIGVEVYEDGSTLRVLAVSSDTNLNNTGPANYLYQYEYSAGAGFSNEQKELLPTSFANDLAVYESTTSAPAVAVAVTDSFASNTGHVRVRGAAFNGSVSTFDDECYAPNPALNGNPVALDGFPIGANGITSIDDFLLVAQSSAGVELPSAFWKYPKTCSGDNATQIEYDPESSVQGPSLAPVVGQSGVDGVYYDEFTGWLYFISRGAVYRACSRDNWETIFVKNMDEVAGAATVTAVGYNAYVLNSFNVPVGGQQTIVRITYEEGVNAAEGCNADDSAAPQVTWMF